MGQSVIISLHDTWFKRITVCKVRYAKTASIGSIHERNYSKIVHKQLIEYGVQHYGRLRVFTASNVG
jgi:hypothetical protein